MLGVIQRYKYNFGWLVAALVTGFSLIFLNEFVLVWLMGIVAVVTLTVAHPLASLTVLMILAPLRTLIATESSIQLPLDIGQILFIVFLLSYAIYTLRERPRIRLRITPVHIALLGVICATALTLLSAGSVSLWLSEWLKWVIMLVIVLLIGMLSVNWQWYMRILIAAGVANALVGIYIFLGGSGADHLVINGRFFRAFGTFGQPNPFGGFLGLILPLALALSFISILRIWRGWRTAQHIDRSALIAAGLYGVAAAILAIGILTSWSRGAWLSTAGAIGIMIICFPRQWWQRFVLASAVIMAAGGIWFSGALPDAIAQRIASSTEEFFAFDDVRGVDITTANYSVVERLAHWQAALNMAQSNPWLGVGFGNYEIAYDQYRLINWDEPLGHAHNYYLNILAEGGIITAILFLTFWGVVVWVTLQTLHSPTAAVRFSALGLLGSWTYLLLHSFLDNLFVNNVFLHLGLLLGILLILYGHTWNVKKLELVCQPPVAQS